MNPIEELCETIADKYQENNKNKYFAVALFYQVFDIPGNEKYKDIAPNTWVLTNTKYFQQDGKAAIDYYANTPCPASQLVEANSNEELEIKIKQLAINFQDNKWLDENIYPYI